MNTNNPYARDVQGHDVLTSLEATPARIHALMGAWPEERFERSYAPGKWTARQLLIHLTHIEMVFATRLRFTLASDAHEIQSFEQDDWMRVEPSASAADALATYLALRRSNLALLRSLSAEARTARARHPEMGVMTVDDLMVWLAGHERHHLPQLETIAATA
jgi:uncharacterized damage-inducible protein DinB